MNIIAILLPLALALGLAGLGAFLWCMRTGQFADLEGAGWRVLRDDDLATGDDEARQREAEPRGP